ncbi:hypothetical protein [Ornithinimicrobium sp. INDO-MA30-4]|uniref:hypothetical protein n=1 Tax=Ornithinimicrobium sp. INDO-MA30-4 TaxID=2908651 RepID=UPI001F3388BA|nr:hypothetical protein [Ornithinimicrobium sp. INDO-MA30-4]UJH69675.1 hypothetical protein L0A91_10095 [Ornithinimicrobium sp. INDO-MA30-4]
MTAVAIFLPLEIATGFLAKSAAWMAGLFEGAGGVDTGKVDFLDTATAPSLVSPKRLSVQ